MREHPYSALFFPVARTPDGVRIGRRTAFATEPHSSNGLPSSSFPQQRISVRMTQAYTNALRCRIALPLRHG
ncbi:MAG: hypothetical protein IKN78_09515 [Bacteroidales bacterium]|nr:hypothetical protein [Bacteroidales bacterium]